MYFSRPPYILYRDYPDFGYLTDNRNLGYDTASKSCFKVGDRILSKSGSVFYSVLTDTPQSIRALSKRLLSVFQGVSMAEIESDAREFYMDLSRDGFVFCGEPGVLTSRSDFFSYANRTPLELEEQGSHVEGSLTIDWGSEYHLARVHVDVSGLCNERCVHCYIPEAYKRETMPLEMFKYLLEQCRACGVLNVTISGGEPMMNPNLRLFIELCRENNFSVNLLSNLTRLTDDLVQEFIKTPLLSVQTSLYSMTPEIHDAITGFRGSFDKTKRAIERLYNNDIPMQINCPIMRHNKDTYQDVLDWAQSMNIEADSDYMLLGCFDGSCKNLQCRLGLNEIEEIINNEKQMPRQAKEHKRELALNDSICPVCLSSFCVSHTGDVYPCEGWQSFVLGNIKETPLLQIWEDSPRIQELRNLTLEDFPKCRSCEDRDYCSICLIRNVNESIMGSYKDVNPFFCQIARVKRRIASPAAFPQECLAE